jgi:phage FluMu protein Com
VTERRCRGCRVRVRLKGPAAAPGTVVRFTCPRCGDLNTTAIPGHAPTDGTLAQVDAALDRVEAMLGPDWREKYAAPRAQA